MPTDPYVYIANIFRSKKASKNVYASFLCLMLEEAEALLGPKVEPYPFMFAGVNFDCDSPRIEVWGEGKNLNHKYIMIRLSRSGVRDKSYALWELSHECIHLLSPTGYPETTVLEEGMATWYQRRWITQCPSVFPDSMKTPSYGVAPKYSRYIEAGDLVEQILGVDETAIKRIRSIEPRLHKINAALIMQEAPWINEQTATELTSMFSL